MDDKKKLGNIIQKEIMHVNPETGEQEVAYQEFSRSVKRENFIQAYVEGISGLLKIDSKVDIRVLISLWKYAEWNTNRLIIVKTIKEEIAKELEYRNYRIIDNSIGRLVKSGTLIKRARSEYYLNPNFFFRGTSVERLRATQFIFTLNIKD